MQGERSQDSSSQSDVTIKVNSSNIIAGKINCKSAYGLLTDKGVLVESTNIGCGLCTFDIDEYSCELIARVDKLALFSNARLVSDKLLTIRFGCSKLELVKKLILKNFLL